ncbi:MAG: TetR/AcrR family transcriptional regulator [Solirubrobacteraceae bacterium]
MTYPTQRVSRAPRLTRAARREQLLDVTKGVVGADGLHAVTIDRVAREAGITRPIIYEHFSDLNGLLDALLDREGVRALAQLSAVLPVAEAEEEIAELLIRALAGYLEAVRTDPVTWRLVLMPPEGAPAFLRERIEQARLAVVAQLAGLIERAYEPAGGQRSPDPKLTAHSMSALSDHWARLLLTDPGHFPLERILTHARWAIAKFAPSSRPGGQGSPGRQRV